MPTETTIYRELGGLNDLIILPDPAITPGMVMVARAGTDWQQRPELRWQAWPDLLVPMTQRISIVGSIS